MSNKVVWVLTREHNDYDQHGEYFEAVFASEPDIQTLAKYFKNDNEGHVYFGDPFDALEFIEHLRKGGGRRGTEDVWYSLTKHKALS